MYTSSASLTSAKAILGSSNHLGVTDSPRGGFKRGQNLTSAIRDSAREIKTSTLQRLKGNSTSSLSDHLNTPQLGGRPNLPRFVILVDKNIAKKARPDPESHVELLAVNFPTSDQVRDAFKEMIKHLAAPGRVRNNLKYYYLN